jgi:hypothetical protein
MEQNEISVNTNGTRQRAQTAAGTGRETTRNSTLGNDNFLSQGTAMLPNLGQSKENTNFANSFLDFR